MASGILTDEPGTPPPEQGDRDAVVRTYLEESKEWREANLELIPVWYRERWTGSRIGKLLKYAMEERRRHVRESGKSYNSDSDGPVTAIAKDMRRAFGTLDTWMAEDAAAAKAKKARGRKRESPAGPETPAAKRFDHGHQRLTQPARPFLSNLPTRLATPTTEKDGRAWPTVWIIRDFSYF